MSIRTAIVDDDPTSLRYISAQLKRYNSDIEITKFETKYGYSNSDKKEDILFIDLVLSDGNGIEILNELPECCDKVVILISSLLTEPEVIGAIKTSHADKRNIRYVAKPLLQKEIKIIFETCLPHLL